MFPLAPELLVGALVRLLGWQSQGENGLSAPEKLAFPYLAGYAQLLQCMVGGRGRHGPFRLHRTAGQQHPTAWHTYSELRLHHIPWAAGLLCSMVF